MYKRQDRAIERVIDQQKLHNALLGIDGKLRVGKHLHATGDRRCASRQGLRSFLDLHQAHPAIGRDREFLVVAEMRDVSADELGGIHDGAPRWYLNLFAVDFNIKHIATLDRCLEEAASRALNIQRNKALLVFNVVRKLVVEMLDETLHWHRGGITERTNGAAHDVGSHAVEQIKVFRTPLPAFNAVDNPVEPVGTFAAWRTPVSYTHLDVYKRQVKGVTGNSTSAYSRAASCLKGVSITTSSACLSAETASCGLWQSSSGSTPNRT